MLIGQLVNSLTHLLPALAGLCVSIFTFKKNSNAHTYWLVSSLLLLMSGIYHLSKAMDWPLAIQIFGRLDHILIWILFGVSAYFINIQFLSVEKQKIYNGVLLALVTIGIWLKSLFFESLLGWPGFLLYLFIIGVGSYSIWEIYKTKGARVLRPFLPSVLLFLSGGLGERLGLFPHSVFHIAVLLGLYFYWRAIRRSV